MWTSGRELTLSTPRMIARVDGALGVMVFNNPERRNAVSLDMWQVIPEIMDAFESDPDVRAIVLCGAGDKAFVSGADISQFAEQRASADAIAHYDAFADRASKRLAASLKPTIAMIRGWCIGGGLGIAVCCDLRIASDTSKFGVPAARLGLGYGIDGVKRLMDLVGPSFTKEIFLTARHFVAHEALAMGLVNRVVPETELASFVREYGETIAQNAPLTMKALKATVTELLRGSPETDRALSDRLVAECFASSDYVEGRTAFMEKRKPMFQGR